MATIDAEFLKSELKYESQYCFSMHEFQKSL